MKTIVLGFGISGQAVAAYLQATGQDFVVVDKNAQALKKTNLPIFDESIPLDGISRLILSPGIPRSHPLVKRAYEKGIEVTSEIGFAFKALKNRCVGITGTNGKTTTTLLIAHVLNAYDISARAVGNVGLSLTSAILNTSPDEVFIVELSSFQLELLNIPCLDYALLLNISEDHLDRYSSMQEYAKTKLSIRKCLKKEGILFASNKVIRDYMAGGIQESVETSETSLTIAERQGMSEENILEEKSTLSKNRFLNHERYKIQAIGCDEENAAFTICKQFGISKEDFNRALKTFTKPPHRLEKLALVNGVRVYNDSKSTSVSSTVYAVKKLKGPLVLIVGGVDKGLSFVPWIQCFEGKVRHVIAYGQAKEKIDREIGFKVSLERVDLFEDAVERAFFLSQKEDTIVLSPGCASFDQFENFEHRGKRFKELVLQRGNGSKEDNFDRGNG